MEEALLLQAGLSQEQAQAVLEMYRNCTAELLQQRDSLEETLERERLGVAICRAIPDAMDPALVESLLDREHLSLGEDGRVEGLAEQLDALHREKPFLFGKSGWRGLRLQEGMDDGGFTREAIAGMTAQEINENWDAVCGVFRGR